MIVTASDFEFWLAVVAALGLSVILAWSLMPRLIR